MLCMWTISWIMNLFLIMLCIVVTLPSHVTILELSFQTLPDPPSSYEFDNIGFGKSCRPPLVVVRRLVDSDIKHAMCFVYEMDCAKEKIKCNFNHIKKREKFYSFSLPKFNYLFVKLTTIVSYNWQAYSY